MILDRDGSGSIESGEIMNYLINENNMAQEDAAQLTDEIINNLD